MFEDGSTDALEPRSRPSFEEELRRLMDELTLVTVTAAPAGLVVELAEDFRWHRTRSGSASRIETGRQDTPAAPAPGSLTRPDMAPGRGPDVAPGRGPDVAPGPGPEGAPGRGPEGAPVPGPEGAPGRGPEAAPVPGPDVVPSGDPDDRFVPGALEWDAQFAAGATHLAELREAQAVIGREEARRARALAAFARSRPVSADRPDGEIGAAAAATRAARPTTLAAVSEWAVDEVAVALSITAAAASTLLVESLRLVDALPGTLAALEEGRITWAHVRVMADLVAPVRDDAVRRGRTAAAGPGGRQDPHPAAGRCAAGGDPAGREVDRGAGEGSGPGTRREAVPG